MNFCNVDGCEALSRRSGYCNKHYLRLRRHGDPLGGGPFFGETKAWIKAHVSHDGQECLYWPFKNKGYGHVRINGRSRHASNYMCELAHGAAPVGKPDALHSCHNGHLGCMNPKHLRWGDHLENMKDKIANGTAPIGSNHPAAVLDEGKVLDIKRRIRLGHRTCEIASEHGVTGSCISSIKSGRIWSHVELP